MKEGKHSRKKFKIIEVYSVLILIAALFMCIGYAEISGVLLKISSEASAVAQEGVFITNITYASDNGVDEANSKINYFNGTMFESEITLGEVGSSITYEVTMNNNLNKEYVFIGVLTDTTETNIYSNADIIYSLSEDIKEYTTIIPAGGELKFTITFKYADGITVSNNTLMSKLNFRFREIPKIKLSDEAYTITDIYPGYTAQETQKYKFTVSNYYSETEINNVPMIYSFETTISNSWLTAKIYDESGTEVTDWITIEGDGETTKTHNYTLEIVWDKSYNSEDYANKEFSCNITLNGMVDGENASDYKSYTITQQSNINIKTAPFYFKANVDSNEIEFNGIEADLQITIKNNDENNNNTYDTDYQISFENNEKFIFSIEDETITDNTLIKTIQGNSMITENLKFKLTLKENADLNLVENIILKIKSTSVYAKEISIPISIKLVPANLEATIDATTGIFVNSSSNCTFTITVKNNNSIPITYNVNGNSTSELILSGANEDISVPANSEVQTTITLSPVEKYIYLTESSTIDISINTVSLYEYNIANYKIKINTYGTTLKDIILAKYTINEITPKFTQNVTKEVDSGVFVTNDVTGTAQYFRGVINNNYVSFAGFIWRIIRVNGDGTTRLVLDSPIGTTTTYKYASTETTVYNSSTIESTLGTWYKNNLSSYNSYINQNTIFLHDRRTSTANSSVYRSWQRLYNASPSVNTSGISTTHLYTVSGNTSGNGKLTYPIGLLTSDEIMMAGAVITAGSTNTGPSSSEANLKPNTAFFIANDVPSGVGLWTMSPFSSTAVICFKSQVGFFKEGPTTARLLKPVIELNSNVTFKGTGTSSDPYVIYK